MAALGWLLNLGFAGSGVADAGVSIVATAEVIDSSNNQLEYINSIIEIDSDDLGGTTHVFSDNDYQLGNDIPTDSIFVIETETNLTSYTYEDFTTYTEVDSSDWISVTSTKLECVNVTRSEDAYVYKDKGAAWFGATFSHDVKATLVTPDPVNDISVVCCWCVSNTVDDFYAWYNGTSEAIVVDFYSNTIQVYETEETETDSYTGTVQNGVYYLTIERTSETALAVRIYSDAGRTSLTDTLNVPVPTGRRYRYIFGANSYDDEREAESYTISSSLTVENLDLYS